LSHEMKLTKDQAKNYNHRGIESNTTTFQERYC